MKITDKRQAGMLKKSGYNDIWKLVRAVAYLLKRFRPNLDFDKISTKSKWVRPGQYLLRRFRQNLDFDKNSTKSKWVRPGQY